MKFYLVGKISLLLNFFYWLILVILLWSSSGYRPPLLTSLSFTLLPLFYAFLCWAYFREKQWILLPGIIFTILVTVLSVTDELGILDILAGLISITALLSLLFTRFKKPKRE